MEECIVSNQGAVLRNLYTNPETPTFPTELKKSNGLLIYPNPTSSFINIIDELGGEYKYVSIYNSIGSKVLSANYNSSMKTIDINSLPNGVYTVVVTADGKTANEEFVIEK
jgi:hypothetical protein